MLVTIAICTRNRSASLARTLHSIERARRVECDWELLVTDNGSSDTTSDVVRSFEGRLPIRMQTEPKPGVANARNAAAAAAKGEYIVGTDDDTIVHSDWFAAYVDAFHAWPDADLFAGRIVPVLEPPVTDWFERVAASIHMLLAIRNMGDESIPLSTDHTHMPYGANCAVRAEIQRKFPFDTRRGPGTTYFGEETTSFKAMMVAGHTGRWVPQSIVDHMISPKRQTQQYVRWWYEALGRTLVWEGHEHHVGTRLFGAPRWLWRRVITGELAFRAARITSPPEVWVDRLIQVSLDRGRLRHFLSPASPSH